MADLLDIMKVNIVAWGTIALSRYMDIVTEVGTALLIVVSVFYTIAKLIALIMDIIERIKNDI